jgi:hypothetical protein
MHENREISNAPSPTDEGRSAKAKGRTADMHALEKSDCAVVPVNQSNKAVHAAAEAGEGRAQMKENIGQSRMLPTQSGTRMSQGLDGMRKSSKGKEAGTVHFLAPPPDNVVTARQFLRTQAWSFSGSRWRTVAGV